MDPEIKRALLNNAQSAAIGDTVDYKHDQGKSRLDLIHWPLVLEMGHVLALGAEKYKVNSWQGVDDGVNRYFAAEMRHMLAFKSGQMRDPESQRSHLAHAATNLMFLHYLTVPAVRVDFSHRGQS